MLFVIPDSKLSPIRYPKYTSDIRPGVIELIAIPIHRVRKSKIKVER